MPPGEKELNVNLLREKAHVERIERVARRAGATIADVLEAIDIEKKEIDGMLYQNPPLTGSER